MDNSPLARLPAELRNRIYELALSHNLVLGYKRYAPWSSREPQRPPKSHPTALMQTCKQICEESTPLLYSSSTFQIQSHADYFPSVEKAIEALRPADDFLHNISSRNLRAFASKQITLDLETGVNVISEGNWSTRNSGWMLGRTYWHNLNNLRVASKKFSEVKFAVRLNVRLQIGGDFILWRFRQDLGADVMSWDDPESPREVHKRIAQIKNQFVKRRLLVATVSAWEREFCRSTIFERISL